MANGKSGVTSEENLVKEFEILETRAIGPCKEGNLPIMSCHKDFKNGLCLFDFRVGNQLYKELVVVDYLSLELKKAIELLLGD
ncbi:hypothetical protein NC652_015872 [Populus alba x Populus x berolinensis]|nr:hypothetical protein NC652_015872 [Populus alba x Populus x berolinensis]